METASVQMPGRKTTVVKGPASGVRQGWIRHFPVAKFPASSV